MAGTAARGSCTPRSSTSESAPAGGRSPRASPSSGSPRCSSSSSVSSSPTSHEAPADRTSHRLAPWRCGSASRSTRTVRRRSRRASPRMEGGLPLHLQPNGDLPGRVRPGRGRPTRDRGAGRARGDRTCRPRPFLYRLEHELRPSTCSVSPPGSAPLVPGEGEILGQVRGFYERGQVGPLLDRLFSHALHTGKKVRTDTAIAEGPGTTSSAAAALAAQVFGNLKGARIAIVGRQDRDTGGAPATKRSASLLRRQSHGNPGPRARRGTAARRSTRAVGGGGGERGHPRLDDERCRSRADQGRARPGPAGEKGRTAYSRPGRPQRSRSAINELADCFTCTTSTTSRRSSNRSWAGGQFARRRVDRRRGGRSVPATGWRTRDVVPRSARKRAEAIRRGELAKAAHALGALGARAERGRVADEPDREQAPARADRALEGSGRRRGPSRGLRIGSRSSRLALTQAELAVERLRRPGLEFALVPVTTAGDRDRSKPSARSAAVECSSRARRGSACA